ncbi:MAG: hypothetical protein GQ570_12165 [Helicobacteraceae bacterium]|nr:hypothetical protein [Helicobacteraceae bacterium]
MSWFSDVVGGLTGGGGGSTTTATAEAKTDINFAPTTNINFDTDGLSNAYTSGSNAIANAYSNATQSQINFDRSMGTEQMKQDETFFLQGYDQNSSLNSALISNDNNIATQGAQIEGAKLQNTILFNKELLKLESEQSKQIAIFFAIGLAAYLYKKNKKGKK